MKNRIIAACGNDCSVCPRYVAHPFEKTEEELRHTAQLWMRIGYRDHVVTNQEISCTGCRPENLCRYHVVKCCKDRGIRTCAECPEYPCENMTDCFEVTISFEPKCREVCTEEEYRQLNKAFFEKENNLSEMRRDLRGENQSVDMPKYRLMTVDDYEAVYDLWIRCGNGLNDKDDSVEGIQKYLTRNPKTSFVATIEEAVVGAILCGHDGRRGIIQHMCVSPECRRMGIGTELVNLAISALKEEGINKVLLVAFKKNEKGNAFWESLGFTIREDLNYRNKALTEMVRIDPDYPDKAQNQGDRQ